MITLILAAALPWLGTSRAHGALVISPTFGSSITSDPNAAKIEGTINQAIQVYQTTFTNNINVTINFNEMSSGLGSSNFFFYNISYASFLAALKANATTADDMIALAHLPNGTSNPVTNDNFIDVKTANLRALGFTGFNSGLAGGVDGIIGLNTSITDVGSPGTTGQYSLLATVEREIDKVLGLGSALPSPVNFFNDPLPEDLFRYDASGNRSFTASTTNAYFSIDGTTDLAQFNNSNNGGDYGDWQSNPRPTGVGPQVQDAFATPGAHPTLGPNEITALDVIGYTPVVVPEPPSVVLMAISGLLLMAHAWRRGKTAVQ
jgi:hypothetical protein